MNCDRYTNISHTFVISVSPFGCIDYGLINKVDAIRAPEVFVSAESITTELNTPRLHVKIYSRLWSLGEEGKTKGRR